ncbi:MAG TPA: BadF/BadG/BcrA/BcrD ATPase family protein [Candidatus Eremiobacteraceae bacterium]|nr:BadF/BadG/BcrA/BcrD ATPase family protein [Candidatus Eremiobacteraceae bacterium]
MSDLSGGVAIGIDAGGTKTVAILVDEEGREIARASSGGANPWDVGTDAARAALHIVLNQLMTGGNVRVVCLGAAGIDNEADRLAAETRLRALLPNRIATIVRNDAAAVLGLIGSSRPAMVVVADTGSIAYGESADGNVTRAGGLGAVLGDCASALSLGMVVLRLTAGVLDGYLRNGPLATAAIEKLNIGHSTEIIARIRHPELDEPLIESLAALLADAAAAGDLDAEEIIEAEGAALARNAAHVARAIRTRDVLPVLIVGKVFGWVPDIRDRAIAAVRKTGKVSIVEATEGVRGAAQLALELATR